MQEEKTVRVPDIGGATQVDVIELLVKPGDAIEKETPLVTLESDKASMEIPSSAAGKVKSLSVKVGDKVSEGDVILVLEDDGTDSKAQDQKETEAPSAKKETVSKASSDDDQDTVKKEGHAEKEEEKAQSSIKTSETENVADKQSASENENLSANAENDHLYAGPAVRRLARELGVELNTVKGSGKNNRITKEDIQTYVKEKIRATQQGASGLSLAPAPSIDFSQFGSIELKPLNKIKRLTAQNVHRAWVTIPHVTQMDEADITDLEAFRKATIAEEKAKPDYKLTMLAFVTKVIVAALKKFPQFNTSLDASGEKLIYKSYYHIGIAVETPNGLVVPVIRNVDQLSIREIAQEMASLSLKAREKRLMPAEMTGGCFTISSLGGIGGTAFTPIVNSPEVAILGLSRSSIKPIYKDGEFHPRLMLPLSLSYDHRVIDGAEAARFTRWVATALEDMRSILL